MSVITFGEILLRLTAPGYTKLFQRDSLDWTFCGAEANVAVSLANFGVDTAFVTKLPDNDVGRAAVATLRTFGVSTSNCVMGAGRMGLYYLEKGVSQRPSKIIYDRSASSLAQSNTDEYDWEAVFKDAEWFHWTGITPALSQNLPQICEAACKTAKKNGAYISCDLNYRKQLWSQDIARETMQKLLRYVDVCIANEEDAEKVLGISAPSSDVSKGHLDSDGYSYVAKEIAKQYGCKYVAITMRKSFSASRNGWSGLLFHAESNTCVYSKEYDIEIVDRVGGGDSFAAGIIYGLLQKMNIQDVVDFAAAASCLKQTIEGDFNRTTISDVEQLLKTGGSGRIQR